MAERYGDELAEALPEVDQVAGFGVGRCCRRSLRHADPGQRRPGARRSTCSTCRGPGRPLRGRTSRSPRAATARAASARSRRSAGPQRSRDVDSILARSTSSAPARSCSSPRTSRRTARTCPASSVPAPSSRSSRAVAERADRVRLLYLYPSDLTDALIDAICDTGVPVLRPVAAARQQAAAAAHAPLGRRRPLPAPHRRHPRARPDAAFRSNFIVGYPGETERDHDQLLALRRGGPARLVRLLLLPPRGRHVRRRARRPGAGRR